MATSLAPDDAQIAVQRVDRVEIASPRVPVEVSVAASFRAMSPDLPTPETITRPRRVGQELAPPGRTRSSSRSADVAGSLAASSSEHPAAQLDQRAGVTRHGSPAR